MFIFGIAGWKCLRIKKIIINCLLLTSIIGAGIAIYHTGVERSWWQPTSSCSPSIRLGENTNLDDFMNQLDNSSIGDCSRPAFYVFGLSLAEGNIVLNFILITLFIGLLRQNEKTNF